VSDFRHFFGRGRFVSIVPPPKAREDSRSFDTSGSCRSLDIDYLGALEPGANDHSAGLFDCPSKSGDSCFQGLVASRQSATTIMSALPPITDITDRDRHVRFVPNSCSAAILSLFDHPVGMAKQRKRYGRGGIQEEISIDKDFKFAAVQRL